MTTNDFTYSNERPQTKSVEVRYLVSVGNRPSRCAQSHKCIETFLDFKNRVAYSTGMTACQCLNNENT